jgi:hypothetical protein
MQNTKGIKVGSRQDKGKTAQDNSWEAAVEKPMQTRKVIKAGSTQDRGKTAQANSWAVAMGKKVMKEVISVVKKACISSVALHRRRGLGALLCPPSCCFTQPYFQAEMRDGCPLELGC